MKIVFKTQLTSVIVFQPGVALFASSRKKDDGEPLYLFLNRRDYLGHLLKLFRFSR